MCQRLSKEISFTKKQALKEFKSIDSENAKQLAESFAIDKVLMDYELDEF